MNNWQNTGGQNGNRDYHGTGGGSGGGTGSGNYSKQGRGRGRGYNQPFRGSNNRYWKQNTSWHNTTKFSNFLPMTFDKNYEQIPLPNPSESRWENPPPATAPRPYDSIHSSTNVSDRPTTSQSHANKPHKSSERSASKTRDESDNTQSSKKASKSGTSKVPRDETVTERTTSSKEKPKNSTKTSTKDELKQPQLKLNTIISGEGRVPRHLQYELDKAVKEKRRQGRQITTDKVTFEYMSPTEDEALANLLSDPLVDQHWNTASSAPDTSVTSEPHRSTPRVSTTTSVSKSTSSTSSLPLNIVIKQEIEDLTEDHSELDMTSESETSSKKKRKKNSDSSDTSKTKSKKVKKKSEKIKEDNEQKVDTTTDTKYKDEKDSILTQVLRISEREEEVRKEIKTLEPEVAELEKQLAELQNKVSMKNELLQSLHNEEEKLREERLVLLRNSKGAALGPTVEKADSDTKPEEKTSDLVNESLTKSKPVASTTITSELYKYPFESDEHRRVASAVNVAEDNSNVVTYSGHSCAVHQMQIKGEYLYTCSADNTIRQFNIESGGCMAVYTGHTGVVKSLRVMSEAGAKTVIYSAGLDGNFIMFDETTTCVKMKQTFQQAILCMTEGWGYIYLGFENGNIVNFNIETKAIEETIQTSPAGLLDMVTCTEGARRVFIVAAYDKTVSVRDVKSGLFLRMICAAPDMPRCLMIDVTRPHIYVGSDKVRVYNYQTGKDLQVLESANLGGKVRSISMSDLDNAIFVAHVDGIVAQYNMTTLELRNITALQNTTVLSLTVKKGRIFVGEQTGKANSLPYTSNVFPCEIGRCRAPLSSKESLLQHIFSSHLSEILLQSRCPWNQCRSNVHHKTVEDLKMHIHKCHVEKK